MEKGRRKMRKDGKGKETNEEKWTKMMKDRRKIRNLRRERA